MPKLYYHCESDGCGSVLVHFHVTEKEANDAEEKDYEDSGEGWGDSSVGEVELKVVDGKIFICERGEFDMDTKTFGPTIHRRLLDE